ncbi:hypothetical protein T4B_3997, partial [Trichinella pseudospiralis]
MFYKRFLKSSSLPSVFSLKLFEDENLSSLRILSAIVCGDFRNHPHTHHSTHSIILKLEMRFSKSSAYTSLFPINLFKDGNVSGSFAFNIDFRNHPHTHHFSHSISLKMEMLA